MKTTLTLITIITSLFFSACANNNRAEYQNPGRAANASLPQNQGAQAQIDPMRDQYVERMAQLQINLMRDQFTKTMSIGQPDGGGLRER
jgi:Skp family chaperone for outer membrane proteins